MYETNELILGKYTTLHRQDDNITLNEGKRYIVVQENCGGKLKHLQVVSQSGTHGYKIQIKVDNNIVFDDSFTNIQNYYEGRNEDVRALTIDNNDQLYIRDILFEKSFKIIITVTESGGMTFNRIITKIFKRVNT